MEITLGLIILFGIAALSLGVCLVWGTMKVLEHFATSDKVVEKRVAKQIAKEDLSKQKALEQKNATRSHFSVYGKSVLCSDFNCVTSEKLHFYHFKYSNSLVKDWIAARESSMREEVLIAESRSNGKDAWHVDRWRVKPCNRWESPCSHDTIHGDTEDEVWEKSGYKAYKFNLISYVNYCKEFLDVNHDFLNDVSAVLKNRAKAEIGINGKAPTLKPVQATQTVSEISESFEENTTDESVDVVEPPIPLKAESARSDSVKNLTHQITENPVNAVKLLKIELGTLRCDICWVMDNPAFFESDSPVSDELFTLLGDWDDNYSSWDINIQLVKASEIVSSFHEAKEQAEMLGTDYLHGKTKKNLEKAASLARKSLSSTHEEEKSSLMKKVVEILSETPTVSLPRQAVKAVEKVARKEIEYVTV